MNAFPVLLYYTTGPCCSTVRNFMLPYCTSGLYCTTSLYCKLLLSFCAGMIRTVVLSCKPYYANVMYHMPLLYLCSVLLICALLLHCTGACTVLLFFTAGPPSWLCTGIVTSSATLWAQSCSTGDSLISSYLVIILSRRSPVQDKTIKKFPGACHQVGQTYKRTDGQRGRRTYTSVC